MFGIEEKFERAVEQVRQALIKALKAKAHAIMMVHAAKTLDQIPKSDIARSQVLLDIAEVLTHLKLDQPKPPPSKDSRGA